MSPQNSILSKKLSLDLTSSTSSTDQVYQMKIKGISICFNILKYSLSGGYVNFGVFLNRKEISNIQLDKSNKIKRIIFEIFISTLKFLKFQITQKK